ncbi:polysaccharide export protein [Rhodoplanes elegans]|uniref:Polysaccharide export protein n=1 Tax=Rhodoplanes elegans TaxID=29408 RepID=A0A327KLE8_9BRAD|nr:polysaccharide biosynthesis/export family protein [Rhodoplanes elegans]MBK5958817.1 polysaccharide export protein [Rhodoplanes elegans]RAI38854.1 polysaccharide export protein [Rhodoplanes elegans]
MLADHWTSRRGTRALLCAVALAVSGASTAFAAEYRLAVGDTLETSVVGIPELQQRIQINRDGEISIPLGGQVRADGLTLAEVRERIRKLLPSKEFRRRNEAGREYPVIIAPSDIDVRIFEYRPIYLSGDVSKPGEVPYRPGLTLRQAVSLAGGYDIMRFRMNNPFLEQSDLRAEYNSLWAEFAKEQVHVARLKAELDGKSEIDRTSLIETPLPSTVAERVQELEAEKLRTRSVDYAKERAYLKEAVAKEEGRMRILTEQQTKEAAGVEDDNEEFRRVQELLQRGSVPITRVVEARRSLLLSSTRQLQTSAQLAQVDRDRDEFSRKSTKLDDDRRLELLNELQEANVKLSGIQFRLKGLSEKLVYVGMVRSQLVRGSGSKPQLTVFRKTEKSGIESLTVAEDVELSPGDVVEVSLQSDFLPGLPAR